MASYYDVSLLERSNPEVLGKIIQYLDFVDASSCAATCQTLAHHCIAIHGPGLLHVPYHQSKDTNRDVTGLTNAMAATSFSSANTPFVSGAEYDSHGSSDTGMTTPDESDQWVFQITPDIIRRLSLLPPRSGGNQLPTLPTELQLEIFSHLDQIDSCCLGLTNRTSYMIFRSIFGAKMPLNTRRQGPNSLERAWEVVGKQECKQCGIYRCELHAHIKSWMPMGLEYCTMRQNFGSPGDADAKANCYRGKPSKPKRCGRHPLRTSSIHQDDKLLTMTSA